MSGGGRWPKLAEKRTSSSTELLSSTFESPERRVTSLLLEKLFQEKFVAGADTQSFMGGLNIPAACGHNEGES